MIKIFFNCSFPPILLNLLLMVLLGDGEGILFEKTLLYYSNILFRGPYVTQIELTLET